VLIELSALENEYTLTGRDFVKSELASTKLRRNSFQTHRALRIAIVTETGIHISTIIIINVLEMEAPSIHADSINPYGIPLIN
jgi:hypothetical protein